MALANPKRRLRVPGADGAAASVFSLLPSWAVRIRPRFAPAMGGARQSNTESSNFSVAKLGGLDSLSIRPSEEQGSVEQYCKFESYSLRHVVRGCGDEAPAAGAGGEIPAISRGFGVAPPRTRSGDGGSSRPTSGRRPEVSAAEFGGSETGGGKGVDPTA